MFASDVFQGNAYRILRLSASATYSDVNRASDSFRRNATLGVTQSTEADLPRLGKVSRNELDIRSAVNRIRTPAQRLQDRLFWFHLSSKPIDESASTKLLKRYEGNAEAIAALNHDKALQAIVAAVIGQLDDAGAKLWMGAIKLWHQEIADDDYWSLIQGIEARGSFEPPALASEISALRDNAIRLAADPLIITARDALSRNDPSTVRRVLSCLDELSGTGSWAELAQEEIISSALVQFRELCEQISAQSNSKILRKDDQAANNKTICNAAIKRFREEIDPALSKLLKFLPPDHRLTKQPKEEAAKCLHSIAINYTWSDDLTTSEKLYEEALKLAENSVVALAIKDGLDQIREMRQKLRIFSDLKPISGTPSLFTFNGIGFTLYGHSDFDAETKSFVAIYYFTILYFPIFPIARYRVINEKGNLYRFLGKLPLRTIDRWHLGISAIAIIGAIVAVNVGANQYPSKPTINSGYGSSATAGYSNSSNYSKQTQLSNLKAKIEAGRSRHDELQRQLQPSIDELSSLDARMKSLNDEIETLDRRKPFQNQWDVDRYNARVNAYNNLLAQYRELVASKRGGLQVLSDLEEQDTTLVNQYNALLKGSK